jgi:hypothetical protein
MVDMPVSDDLPSKWRPESLTTGVTLKRAQWLLATILIASGCWVAVNEATAENRCETKLAKLSVYLKLDSYYSGCRCMKHSLDFSDSCNSMYIPLVF